MTKKLIGLLGLALFSITTINAASGTCTVPAGTNNGVATAPGSQPLFTATFTCTFSIPTVDTLTGVSLDIDNGWIGGTVPGPNNVTFTYSTSGFGASSGTLTDTVQSGPQPGDPNGNAFTPGYQPDEGNITGGTLAPSCSYNAPESVICTALTANLVSSAGGVNTYSFTVTGGASLWNAGSLQSGSDTSNVFFSDSYTAPPPPVPEPGTLLMMGGGLIGLVLAGRRKFRA
jgi:hypothetical protein